MENSRLLSQLELLEKYVANRSSFKSKEEELTSFRNTTGKILSQIEGPERIYRDIIVKHTGKIDALITALQTVNDSHTNFNIVKIICELVGKSNTGRRAQILVHQGVSKALLQCIYNESKEQFPCEDYMFLLHQVLYKVGVKDKRIGVRARLSQCLPVLVNMFRTQVNLVPHNRGAIGTYSISSALAKNMLTILYVLKLYCQNLINTSRLGRIGTINLLLKIITYCSKNNMIILKISIETLNLCVRTKSNSSRAINQGGMSMLLELFLELNRVDNKNKHLSLRKGTLCVIKNLINLRSGKKAFLESDGLHMLYGFCDANKQQSNMEALVTISSLILRKCFPRNRLPLAHYGSVMTCPLPSTIIQQKARLLMEEYSKNESSPSAPRSTSPLEVNPLMLHCIEDDDDYDDDDEKMDNIGDDHFYEDIDDEKLTYPTKELLKEKQANRKRATNLFKSLDKKLLQMSQKETTTQQHRVYVNKYCHVTDSENINNSKVHQGRPGDRDNSPYQDYSDEKKDQKDEHDQILVEHMLVNSLNYQPADDRSIDSLKLCYDKFFLEREIFKKSRNEMKKSTFNDDLWDKLDPNENLFENRFNKTADLKSSKTKESSKSPVNPLQSNATSLDKKLSRITIQRNELEAQKSSELSDKTIGAFLNSEINFPNRGSNKSEILHMSSKCAINQTQREDKPIDINLIETGNNDNEVTNNSYLSNFGNNDSQFSNEELNEEFTYAYIKISSLFTRSLGRFSRIAYPDLMEDSVKIKILEPLSDSFLQNYSFLSNDEPVNKSGKNNNAKNPNKNLFSVTKKQSTKGAKSVTKSNSNPCPSSDSPNIDALAQNKILDDLRRIIDGEDILEKVVFDLESIIQSSMMTYNLENSSHSNTDELEIGKLTPLQSPELQFDSQFECGNLRKVIQIRQYEYDLILNPDVNCNHQIQWFYFRVAGMESGVPYRFNIINCEKPNSQFNFGMQPLLYSVKEAMLGKSCWKRSGTEIFYYKNHFARSAATCGGNIGRSYYTFTFVIYFPHAADVCYMAYHYPYTYTRLLTDIHQWNRKMKSCNDHSNVHADGDSKEKFLKYKIEFYSVPEDKILFFVQELCTSILGNSVPFLTISNWPNGESDRSVGQKPYIFLTSRVHPGESNASWIMKGCIDYLLSDCPIAEQLRNLYVFKIVPMLNPDGVINGCHRCSMAGHDLNRRWLDPCEFLNPTIYHTKGLLMLLSKYGQSPLVYCDFHGHSRRKNVFMFGCSSFQSWISEDTNNPTFIDSRTEDKSYLILPNILNNISSVFSFDCCSFTVEKSKESTARVVVWRQFGVKRSYTMESTYCSCDQGNFKHVHINVPMLQEMGSQFAEALLHIDDSASTYSSKTLMFPKVNLDQNHSSKAANGNSKYGQPNSGKQKEASFACSQDKNKYEELNFLEDLKNEDEEVDNEASSNEDDGENESESEKEIEFIDEQDAEDSD